jgi:hypothetical protein
VNLWWSKQKRTSPHKRLEQIAEVLSVRAEWLLTGRGEPLQDGEPAVRHQAEPLEAIDVVGISVVGAVEGEAWREGRPPDLKGLSRFAFEVRGTSANRTIRPGEFVLCVDYRQARAPVPQHKDLVVVKKGRGTSEYKIFVARLHYFASGWELRFESNDPHWQERSIRLSEDLSRDALDGDPIEIIGYVAGVLRADPQPMFDFSS